MSKADYDQQIAEQVKWCRRCNVTAHVDRNGKLRFRDKETRKLVGFLEMKKRVRVWALKNGVKQ